MDKIHEESHIGCHARSADGVCWKFGPAVSPATIAGRSVYRQREPTGHEGKPIMNDTTDNLQESPAGNSAEQPDLICPECGASIEIDDVICPHCGISLAGG
jgi:hypothetical protein